MTEKTLFEKIIEGEIPSVKVYEDNVCIVIMDKFPDTKGKCLVIPRKPVDYAFDLDDETYVHLMIVAKRIVEAIDKALKPYRTCLLIEGFEIPHTHIKLFPLYEPVLKNELGPETPDEELEEVAKLIRAEL